LYCLNYYSDQGFFFQNYSEDYFVNKEDREVVAYCEKKYIRDNKIYIPKIEVKNTLEDDIIILIAKKYNFTKEQILQSELDYVFKLYYNVIAEQYREFITMIFNHTK